MSFLSTVEELQDLSLYGSQHRCQLVVQSVGIGHLFPGALESGVGGSAGEATPPHFLIQGTCAQPGKRHTMFSCGYTL